MINKRRPCRLNIFIRYTFHFCRQKPASGSVRRAELDRSRQAGSCILTEGGAPAIWLL